MADIDIDMDQEVVYAAGHMGLFSVDISDPTNPDVFDLLSPSWFGSRFYDVEVGPEGRVFATNRDGGLSMVDSSDPANLRELDRIQNLGMSGMATTEDLLLVAGLNGDLWVYEIDHESLSLRAQVDGLGHAWSVVVHDSMAYVGNNDAELIPVDLSNPDSPQVLTAIAAAGGLQNLALSPDGQTLYAAAGGAGVEVFSLDEPEVPESVNLISAGYSAMDVAHGQDLLWAATLQDVVAFDLSEPRSPQRLNTEETPQWAMAVTAEADRVYVADWAWVSSYQRVQDGPAPDLDPATNHVLLNEDGDQVEIELFNFGNAELILGTASTNDSRLSIWTDSPTIAPGDSQRLRVDYSGGGNLIAEICLSSSDPDDNQIRIQVQDRPTDDLAGLGSEAPDFELEDLDGVLHRLSDQRGRPVVLVYFATW